MTSRYGELIEMIKDVTTKGDGRMDTDLLLMDMAKSLAIIADNTTKIQQQGVDVKIYEQWRVCE